MMVTVSVVVPTFRRPEGLKAAVASLIAQSHQPDELVIIDNSPEGSARQTAQNARAVARFDVVYVHEPSPGVANARNAGLAAAKGRYIAFLDDDEIATPLWLAALLYTSRSMNIPVVFGPLRGETHGISGLRDQMARRLYSRRGPSDDILLDEPFGCGNSLIDRENISLPESPFDPSLNETGGEDDAFFADLENQGAQFAWSARAHAIECVDGNRTSWRHLLSRSFAFGQGATQNSAYGDKPNWLKVCFWMGIGLAQLVVYSPLAGLSAALKLSSAAEFIDKTVQAAGKVMWFGWFVPKFYGESAAAE